MPPSSMTASLRNVSGLTENLTDRTEPSVKRRLVPPGCELPNIFRQTVPVEDVYGFGGVLQMFEGSPKSDPLWLLAWFLQVSLLSLTILVAAGLYGLVLLTFNRCLGRAPEWSRRPTEPMRRELRKRPMRTRLRALAGAGVGIGR